MENLDLIRKMAWDFKDRSNLEYQELFSEAALAYSEAVVNFDASKGAKLTTFAWRCIFNHLMNFCRSEQKYRDTHLTVTIGHGPKKPTTRHQKEKYPHMQPVPRGERFGRFPKYLNGNKFDDKIEHWPEDCSQVIDMILDNPEYYLGATANYTRQTGTPLQRVKSSLRNKGWTHHRINKVIRGIKTHMKDL